MLLKHIICIPLVFSLAACSRDVPREEGSDAAGFSAPTLATIAAQAQLAKTLPVEDGIDLQEAERGFIAREDVLTVKNAAGAEIYSATGYDFMRVIIRTV